MGGDGKVPLLPFISANFDWRILTLTSNCISSNRVVYNSLKIYSQFRKHFGLHQLSFSSPIASNNLFPPSLQDATFRGWRSKGLKNFKDLFIENKFASFAQLSNKYDLPTSHFFRYLQIRHFIASSNPKFPDKPLDNIIDELMSFDPTKSKAVTSLIKLITHLDSQSSVIIKQFWEQDLQITMSEAVWADVLKKIHSSSICARHSLIQFKVVHRAHLDKSKLAKIFPQIDPICDRCRSEEATLVHMFWNCPRIQIYWAGICEALSAVLGVHITPNPFMLMFGITPEGLSLPTGGGKVIAFSTLLARRLILLKWKDAAPPTVSSWIKEVLINLKLEKIRCVMKGSENRFYKTWKSFMIFFNKPSTQVQE